MHLDLYIIIISLLGIVVLINLCYYGVLFSRFSFHKAKKIKHYQQDPVSIIVAAKNDAHHLMKSLPILLTQQYIDYEVIVVNDNSDDETTQVAEDFKSIYSHLKYIDLNSSITNIKGKKFPISIGIRAAKNNIILLTEPDAIPNSSYWLQNMSKHFVDKTEIVLGYATYEKKKGLFNSMLRFDALHTAIQYFSYALAKIPFMGIGRNLAYTKTLFMKNKGFTSHNHILYGEDDLFINHVATKTNCAIEYSKETIVKTPSKLSFFYWIKFKKNHHLTRKYYQKKHKFLLGFYEWLSPLFYIFFIVSLLLMPLELTLLSALPIGLFFIRILTQYLIFGFAAVKLREKKLIPYILLYDVLFACINPFINFASKMTRNQDKLWK